MRFCGLLLVLLTIVMSVGRTKAAPAAAPAAAPSTAVDGKLWAMDLPAFLNDHPRQHWIVGRSGDAVALSEAEAESAACNDAAEQIAALMAPTMAKVNVTLAMARIGAVVRNGDWIADRQVEAIERPYATLWRAAVLVKAEPRKIDALGRQLEAEVTRHRATAAVAMGGATIWAAIVCLGFVFFNWLTRGYFRGRLLFGSLLLIATGFVGAAQLL